RRAWQARKTCAPTWPRHSPNGSCPTGSNFSTRCRAPRPASFGRRSCANSSNNNGAPKSNTRRRKAPGIVRLRPWSLPHVPVWTAHPGAVPSERPGHPAPARPVDADEERSAPETEAVETDTAEAMDAEPGEPRPTPSAAAPAADMADAGMTHTDVTNAGMTN